MRLAFLARSLYHLHVLVRLNGLILQRYRECWYHGGWEQCNLLRGGNWNELRGEVAWKWYKEVQFDIISMKNWKLKIWEDLGTSTCSSKGLASLEEVCRATTFVSVFGYRLFLRTGPVCWKHVTLMEFCRILKSKMSGVFGDCSKLWWHLARTVWFLLPLCGLNRQS